MKELEIKLVLRFRVPESGLTVNGILQGLEDQIPVIFIKLLESTFKAVEERAINRLIKESPGRYTRNGHQRNKRKFITQFGTFRYRMAQMQDRELGKTIVPLAQELEITPHKHYQAKAMEASIGLGGASLLCSGKQ